MLVNSNFINPFYLNFIVSSDMIDGNKKIFERVWKLILKAEKCEFNKFEEADDLKQIAKLNQDIHKIRNVQLSMVNLA